MSWIASFYACDGKGCGKVFPIRNDQEHTDFEETWTDGVIYDFCPECSAKPENISLIEAQAKALNSSLEMVTI